MRTIIAYNSLPVSELLAEFDERWPLPMPDADNVQELVDRLLDGGYAKLGANMRKTRKAMENGELSAISEGFLQYINRAIKRYARSIGITRTTCSRGKHDSLLRTRDSSGRATARKAF